MEKVHVAYEHKESVLHPHIANEVISRADEDQKMRKAVEQGGKLNRTIDYQNTEFIKEVIEKIGYPTISKVGKEASHKAWLLIQHGDHDPEFQAMCLELMKSQMPGEIELKDIGYLEDRVRVKNGDLQLYGTQFYTNAQGVFGPKPIQDPEHLDERREALNMGSFEEYKHAMIEANKDFAKNNKTVK